MTEERRHGPDDEVVRQAPDTLIERRERPEKTNESDALHREALQVAQSVGASYWADKTPREVGLSVASITLDLPPEIWEQVVEEAMRRLRAEMEAGLKHGRESDYLNHREAAAYLRTSEQRLYDLVSHRRLRPHKDGRRNLFKRTELDAYLRGEKANGS